MPIGAPNLNLYIFELGILSRRDGQETARTVSVHPLLVAPSSVSYQDPSRSTALQTVGGAIDTRGGRGLRMISLDGVFGVEDRRAGLFGGTGEERYQSFKQEIVRMGDALTRDAVSRAISAEKRVPSRVFNPTSRVLQAALEFNEQTDTPFVNFYDFWEGESLQVQVRAFQPRRQHRQGGATGLVAYSMTLQEVGPAVASTLGQVALPALMDFLTTWQGINDTIESWQAFDVVEGEVAVDAVFSGRVAESFEAVGVVADRVQRVLDLMAGGRERRDDAMLQSTTTPAMSGFFGTVRRALNALAALDGTAIRDRPFSVDRGVADWSALLPPPASDASGLDVVWRWREMQDALTMQLEAGAFFGLDAAAYRAFIESGGSAGPGPLVGGSLPHIVTETDTVDSIEAAYGVSWALILAVNALTPDEALITGTTLQIPVTRPTGPQGIDGLPVFGPHVGQGAWGLDLLLEHDTDTDGDLLTVNGPDVLEQGIIVLVEAFASEVLGSLDGVPEAGTAEMVRAKIAGLLRQDPRVVTIAGLDVAQESSGFRVDAIVRALNGGSVLVGGSP